MRSIEWAELIGLALVLGGLWLLVVAAAGVASAWSVAAAGVLVVLLGAAMVGSANRRGDA